DQVQPVLAAEDHVRQDQIERRGLQQSPGIAQARRLTDRVARSGQRPADREPQIVLIFDGENFGQRSLPGDYSSNDRRPVASGSRRGNRNTNVAPHPPEPGNWSSERRAGGSSRSSWPPWALATCCATASPMPLPSAF